MSLSEVKQSTHIVGNSALTSAGLAGRLRETHYLVESQGRQVGTGSAGLSGVLSYKWSVPAGEYWDPSKSFFAIATEFNPAITAADGKVTALPWKPLSITILADFQNHRLPTDSADEAKNRTRHKIIFGVETVWFSGVQVEDGERWLHEWELWMRLGQTAFERHERLQPHRRAGISSHY